MDWGFGGGWMVLGSIFFIVFWGAIIWLIVWGVRTITSRSGGGQSSGKSALDIAKERYARGEISKAEFEQIKKDLS
jgi:putative membrane protein